MIRNNLNNSFRLRIMRTCILKRLPKLVVISDVIADGKECIKMKTHAGSAQNWYLLFIKYADWKRCCCRLKLRIWLIGQLIQACFTWGTRLRFRDVCAKQHRGIITFAVLGPVSQKSRNFSGLFRVPQFHLYLRNAEVLSLQTSQSSWFFLY